MEDEHRKFKLILLGSILTILIFLMGNFYMKGIILGKVIDPRTPTVSSLDPRADSSGNLKTVDNVNYGALASGVSIAESSDSGWSFIIDNGVIKLNFLNPGSVSPLFNSTCISEWNCGEFGGCFEGKQIRECTDLKNCLIPTTEPVETQKCFEPCTEFWSCEGWTDCSGGVTSPFGCVDLNDCGTNYNKPRNITCGGAENNGGEEEIPTELTSSSSSGISKSSCTPDIFCEEWSSCEIDYNFNEISAKNINNLDGTKKRTCVDRNGCINSVFEEESCLLRVEAKVEEFTRCGVKYIALRDIFEGKLLAKIVKGTPENPSLDIYLGDRTDDFYCETCFNGILDGDETEIDCGGGCSDCQVLASPTITPQKFNFFKWFSNLFS